LALHPKNIRAPTAMLRAAAAGDTA